ncbi:MAG: hypothetical protein ACREMF_00690 [Gemmatimonadales bacterium]
MSHARRALAATLALALGYPACSEDTSRLSLEQERRFGAETVLRRADNVWFRYTHDPGTRSAGWEDRLGSILVTRQTVLIHKNDKVGIEITRSSRPLYDVSRAGARVRIGAGSGRLREVWSFEPPDDATGWTEDIRAVIRLSARPAAP